MNECAPTAPLLASELLKRAAVVGAIVLAVAGACARTGNGGGCYNMGETATMTPGFEGGPLLTVPPVGK